MHGTAHIRAEDRALKSKVLAEGETRIAWIGSSEGIGYHPAAFAAYCPGLLFPWAVKVSIYDLSGGLTTYPLFCYSISDLRYIGFKMSR